MDVYILHTVLQNIINSQYRYQVQHEKEIVYIQVISKNYTTEPKYTVNILIHN